MAGKGKTTQSRKRKGKKTLAGGDVPSPAKHTYHTISRHLPVVSETCVVRSIQVSNITASAGSDVKPTYYFSLSNAGTASTGFFDQYRIEAIRFTVAPDNNAVGLVTNSTTDLVPCYCCIDYDDASALASSNEARAYSNCMVLAPGESGERTFQPHMAISAYTGAFGGFANVAPMFIDAGSPTVQHYGVKMFIPAATVGQTLLQSWTISIEYFLTFRKSF